MRTFGKFAKWIALACLGAGAGWGQASSLAELQRAFERPPDDARIMMRWWWFGPAVTKPELEREIRLMKQAGIGGFEVQPVYPLSVDDPTRGIRNLPYLSPEFLDDLQFLGEKAHELGLRMDLTLCSGWPYGGPHIPVSEASARLRVERVPVPAAGGPAATPRLEGGESLIGKFETGSPTGRVEVFVIASRTRQMVKRAAVGAEGFVLDHYSREAVETHLKVVGEPLLKALANTPPHAVFSDSLEVYNSDWTADFLAEFKKRRGYDLAPHLEALVGDTEESPAIRHDWGRTLTELFDERYLGTLGEWAHAHKTLFRSQTYGVPPASLSSNALVDLPEGENWNWRQLSPTRWASSASHLYGRPMTSSETWTWLHSPAFRATPLDMKAEADRHFLEGINQLVGHGWPYSPPGAGDPGWMFYAAAVFNEHNPWWIVMPDVTAYLQRMSFLLRQGRPANDVAIYLATDDAWASFTPGNASINQSLVKSMPAGLIPAVLDAGYNFDLIDDGAIERVGVPYPILIVPNVERIPVTTYRKIEQYSERGGIVIALGRLPSLAPGFLNAASETTNIHELSHSLFESNGARAKHVEDDRQLGAALHQSLPPDASLPHDVYFIHRKLDFADVYFVANTSNRPVRGAAAFRTARAGAEWWDPFTGRSTPASGAQQELDLAPYESRVLIFSDSSAGKPPAAAPAGRAIDISSGWSIQFADSRALPVEPLRSWTEQPGMKYFSGVARYERTVSLDPSALASSREIYLNFGEGTPVNSEPQRAGNGMRAMLEGPVREAAIVYVNGKLAGSVWRPPYEIAIKSLLQSGRNSLRVEVANLAINELAGRPLPDYKALNARFGERFQQQDMENLAPVPSGLLGPIRLIPR